MVPCTLLGAILGLLLPNPLNGNDAKVLGEILTGAILGLLIGLILDGCNNSTQEH
jgi:hypothetical protein